MLKGNMLIAHGGGPTPVINTSLLGAVTEAKKHDSIEKIYGAKFGAEGILKGDLVDLGALPDEKLALLKKTPASALGSCRRKLSADDTGTILKCFKKFNIRYFFYNGGNDSMDTCHKIHRRAEEENYELAVIGIPKTIDNDLALTDHCPGYGSAARYAALSALELSFDAFSLPIHVIVMELMGRNAGWLTAASAVFRDLMPSELLVYLPETDFDRERFLSDVKEAYAKGRGLLVTVSEGIHYADGTPVADTGITDGFGHRIPGGAAQTLSDMIMSETDLKSRSEKPGLLGRVSMAHLSEVDAKEAFEAGSFAVKAAADGKTGYMAGFVRSGGEGYASSLELFELEKVANAEKLFPAEWINERKNGILPGFNEYAAPLLGRCDTRYCRIV